MANNSSRDGWQALKVYDLLGNEMATLVDEYKPSGNYEIEFNGNNLSSGVYVYNYSWEILFKQKK